MFTKAFTKKRILLFFFTLAILFTRTINLDHTARFTQDESSDLARMYQYWQSKKITFVGPISNDGSKVFSSLTYYMVMPFAAATSFTPIGPVYGTAFWGIITAFLMLLIVRQLRREWLIPMGLLIIVWYPLVEMSRWAWNPHFVMFWGALGVLGYLYRERWSWLAYFVSGLCFGLMFHHHYLSIFATAPFVAYAAWEPFTKKQYKLVVSIFAGYVAAHLPFVLFDLRHPPGLFFGRYLFSGHTPHVETELTITKLLSHLWRNYLIMIDALVKPKTLQILLGVALPALAILDARSKQLKQIIWYIPAVISLVCGMILDDYEARYIYPAFIFLFVWFIQKRSNPKVQIAAMINVGLILLGSLLTIWGQLATTLVPPDIYSLTLMSQYVEKTIQEKKVVNPNVAVIASPDSAPLGEKYRDVIGMHGVQLRAPSEYGLSENLFAITTSSLDELRADKSYAIDAFKTAGLKGTFEVPNSQWRVFWLGYGE